MSGFRVEIRAQTTQVPNGELSDRPWSWIAPNVPALSSVEAARQEIERVAAGIRRGDFPTYPVAPLLVRVLPPARGGPRETKEVRRGHRRLVG